jgi:hypothetical protein
MFSRKDERNIIKLSKLFFIIFLKRVYIIIIIFIEIQKGIIYIYIYIIIIIIKTIRQLIYSHIYYEKFLYFDSVC